MKHNKRIEKLEILTNEADMLVEMLDNALQHEAHRHGICAISYLSSILRNKFFKILNLF